MLDSDQYSDFVEHPRFGRAPRITNHVPKGKVFLHGLNIGRIPFTAIPANLDKQTSATIQVTHYYDLDRQCRDCKRMFIFFAAEQKHWYEDLGFPLESNCVRCVPCRKTRQEIARSLHQYQQLFHLSNKTPYQCLQMAECSLELIEKGVFTRKQYQRIRLLLKQLRDDYTSTERIEEIRQRLNRIEQSTNDVG